MITTDYCRLMANYNQWMNQRLYAVCAELDESALKEDRGAFFGSIFSTLNHIVYGDLAYLSRFTGDPPDIPPLGEDLYDNLPAMRQARDELDRRLLQWATALEQAWLAEEMRFTSKVDGKQRCLPRWVMVTHMFNHQTHHRGQVTTLLSQLGKDMGSTDIPFVPGVASVD